MIYCVYSLEFPKFCPKNAIYSTEKGSAPRGFIRRVPGFSVIRHVFSFQNNPENLDPFYKMDLGLWDCLGRV